jgi:hypothetical protein
MIIQGQILSASNLNSAYISQTNTSPQAINSTLTISGGAITLKNSSISDNAGSSYLRISPQGNNLILYDGIHNQQMSVYSSSGSESTYITTINGTKSIGLLDVSSAIDHLEVNTNSGKYSLFGGDIQTKGIVQLINPSNASANFFLSWFNNDARLRIGGNGSGSAGYFRVQGAGDADRLTVDSAGNGQFFGNLLVNSKITATGGVGIKGSSTLSFDDYGGSLYMSDTTWLRVGGSKSFYHSGGEFRTDGTLEVGSSGATFKVTNGGQLNYNSGKFTIDTTGVVTSTGPLILNTAKTQGTGINLDGVTIDTAVSGGSIALGGLTQLRFGSSTSYDWNQWAGIKYDSVGHYLYIGGPASPQFSSNASPPTINVSFTGVGNVGIGTLTPSQALDVVGNVQTNQTFISNSTSSDVIQAMGASGTKTFRWEGGNLRFYTGQNSVGEAVTFSANGNIGINQPSPTYKLDVTGDIRTTTAFRATLNNSAGLYVGSNSAVWDVNTANTLGVYGQQNTAIGAIKLGSTGPTIFGSGGTLAIATTAPNTAYTLHNAGAQLNTGTLTLGTSLTTTFTNQSADGSVRVSNSYGYIDIAPKNTTYAHIYTDRPQFYFNQDLLVTGNKVWHAGNISPLSKTGDIMTGSLQFDVTSAERDIQFVSGGVQKWGFYGNSSGLGLYDWQNSRTILSYGPSINSLTLSPATTINNSLTVNGTVTLNNNTISGITTLTGQYGKIASSRADEWLGINDDFTHTSGVYFGNSTVRTDGTLQIGSGGSFLSASPTTGVITINSNAVSSTGNTIISGGQVLVNRNSGHIQLQESGNNTWHIESVNKQLRFVQTGVAIQGWFQSGGAFNISGYENWDTWAAWNVGLKLNAGGHHAIWHTTSDQAIGFHGNGNIYFIKGMSGTNSSYAFNVDTANGEAYINGSQIYAKGKHISWGSGAPAGGSNGDIYIQI